MKFFKKINYKRLAIYFLLAFAMFIIGSWPVKAFEMVYPNYEFVTSPTTQATTYYGYNLPNRVNTTADVGETYNYVSIGLITTKKERLYSNNLYFNSHPTINYNLLLSDNNTPNDSSDDVYREETLPSANSWFTDWIDSNWINSVNENYNNYLVMSYHPGQSGSKGDVLDNGRYIDYDSYYSYSYYMEIINNDSTGNSYLYWPILNAFTSSTNMVQGYSCVNSSGVIDRNKITSNDCEVKVTLYEASNQRILLKYDVIFNKYQYNSGIYLDKFRFNDNGFTYCNSGCNLGGSGKSYFSNVGGLFGLESGNSSTGLFTTNYSVIGSYNLSNNKTSSYKFRVSQPFDLVMWTTDSSLFCQEDCWTQEDTNNNSWVEKKVDYNENNILSNLFKFNVFDDIGTFQVIESVFDEIRLLLANDYNNSCYTYDIVIYDSVLSIMCGHSFWSRNDIGFFKGLWELFWTGLIGFWVARSVYLKLLSLVDVDNGVVIDAKEVTRL